MTLKALFLISATLMVSVECFAAGFNLEHEHVPNELIVKFKNQGSKTRSLAQTRFIESISGRVKHQFKSSGAQVIQFPHLTGANDLKSKALALSARSDVQYVEANLILRANKIPNDHHFIDQRGLRNSGSSGGVAGADIRASEAWNIATGSRDVLVAVIDTGVDYSHPDIAQNYWTNPGESGTDAAGNNKQSNGIDDDGNGYIDDFRGWDFANNDNDPMDDESHGTHCAGVIGAGGNNDFGIAGVNWNVSLVGIKFLSDYGTGTVENAVKAIEYATSIGAAVSSNSWGGDGFSVALFDAIINAGERGVLFVASAGNGGRDTDQTPYFPAGYLLSNVISVAASDRKDELASYTNHGPHTVHVAAPGDEILSTTPGGKFASMSGASVAAPHVAGIAALVKAAYPDASMAQIRARVINGIDRSSHWTDRVISGGRVNAFKALEADTTPPAAIEDLNVVDREKMSITLEWSPVGDDGNAGQASTYEIRISHKPITSEADWVSAKRQNVRLSDVNGHLRATLPFDDFNSHGFIAVRAFDNVGNLGLMAPSTPFETTPVQDFFRSDGRSLDGFTVEKPWSIEIFPGDERMISDSPHANYKPDLNSSITTPKIFFEGSQVYFVANLYYDLEPITDSLFIEISADDGATWKQLDRLSGPSVFFTRRVYDLSGMNLPGSFKARLRLKTDSIDEMDGVRIKGLSAIGAH